MAERLVWFSLGLILEILLDLLIKCRKFFFYTFRLFVLNGAKIVILLKKNPWSILFVILNWSLALFEGLKLFIRQEMFCKQNETTQNPQNRVYIWYCPVISIFPFFIRYFLILWSFVAQLILYYSFLLNRYIFATKMCHSII